MTNVSLQTKVILTLSVIPLNTYLSYHTRISVYLPHSAFKSKIYLKTAKQLRYNKRIAIIEQSYQSLPIPCTRQRTRQQIPLIQKTDNANLVPFQLSPKLNSLRLLVTYLFFDDVFWQQIDDVKERLQPRVRDVCKKCIEGNSSKMECHPGPRLNEMTRKIS